MCDSLFLILAQHPVVLRGELLFLPPVKTTQLQTEKVNHTYIIKESVTNRLLKTIKKTCQMK